MVFAVLFWLCAASIVYTYAGYPLLLGVLARLWPKTPRYPQITPTVTLLIAAYNEEAVIAQKLENCFTLDYPRDRLQILVAADGSDDRTADIVREYAGRGVELSYTPQRTGKMAAINRAMPSARGKIVVFSDANNLYDSGTLRHLVMPFADATVGAVSGAKHIRRSDGALGESEGLYWKYESFIKEQESRMGTCVGVAGEILAIRRELFEPPPGNIINDDFYMAMQIVRRGYRVVYAPEAASHEGVSISAQDEVARRSRIVAGRYQAISHAARLLPWRKPMIIWQIISHKFLRPLVPFAMIGALVANGGAVIWPSRDGSWALLAPPISIIFLILQLAFYLVALAGNLGRPKSKLAKIFYLPTFLVNSNMAAVIGLYRFASNRQSTLWQKARRADDGTHR